MLVIFDCDGVIADSETLSNQMLCKALNSLGLALSLQETMDRFMGRSSQSCVQQIEQEIGRAVPADFWSDLQHMTFAQFDKHLKPVVGVPDLLASLAHPYCLASSGSHEKMQRTLGITGLKHHFQGRIFSASDVKEGKPAPDLFLYAAGCMGFAAGDCVVIEDSMPGVQAALKAGMLPLAYCGLSASAPFEAIHVTTFDSMASLPQLLEQL